MQIHELNEHSGTAGSSDYFAVDNGTVTNRIAGDSIYPAMTQSNITAGTSTTKMAVTPKILKSGILAVARMITDTWVDISSAKVNLNTSASSGTDHDLYAVITALGWQSDVIE